MKNNSSNGITVTENAGSSEDEPIAAPSETSALDGQCSPAILDGTPAPDGSQVARSSCAARIAAVDLASDSGLVTREFPSFIQFIYVDNTSEDS